MGAALKSSVNTSIDRYRERRAEQQSQVDWYVLRYPLARPRPRRTFPSSLARPPPSLRDEQRKTLRSRLTDPTTTNRREDYNYPPWINVLHFDIRDIEEEDGRVAVRLAHVNYMCVLATFLLNLLGTIVMSPAEAPSEESTWCTPSSTSSSTASSACTPSTTGTRAWRRETAG